MNETRKIIFEGISKKNKHMTIRYPEITDAKSMWSYINTLSKEKTFIRFQGEVISFEDEQEYLDAQLKKISQRTAIHLLTFYQDELIGISGIEMLDKTERHVGLFGLSVHKNFREEGIGSLLMQLTIDEAVKNISLLEMVTLCVFSNHIIGLKMYKKHGFIEYGKLPNGIKLENKYVDQILMYKAVKS